MNRRLARLAALFALLAPLALAEVGCAGVTAADLEPHVATARDLARRNNAAIATHCVGMAVEDRQALIRDNIDHAAQLGALHQSADDGPGWISQVIAWALSFSRLAGIVASDPQIETPEQPAMDGNTTEPDAPTPDDDGDGFPNHREANIATHARFRAWLEGQRARADPVGDFANDFLDGVARGCCAGLRTLGGIDHHLRTVHGADDEVLDARDRAWREFALLEN